MIKLIVSDLDGTLFNASHNLDEESACAIHEAQSAGIMFMVATGRGEKNVTPFFEEFNIQCPKILLNGAVYLNEQNNAEYLVPMDHDDVRKIFSLFLDNEMAAYAFCADGLGCTNLEKMAKEIRIRLKNKEHLSDEEIELFIEETCFFAYDFKINDIEDFLKEHPQVFKLEAFANDEERIQVVRDSLHEMKHLDVSNSVGDNIEVTDVKAQKGTMLEKVCQQLHIKKEEVVTIGDSLNDVSMIRDFPNSYAVANACDLIKKLASNQIESNVDHGVAKLIRSIIDKQGR